MITLLLANITSNAYLVSPFPKLFLGMLMFISKGYILILKINKIKI